MDKQALRDRQLAFFLSRVVSDEAKLEWRAHFKHGVETLLESPLERIASADSLDRAIVSALRKESFVRAIRPISRSIHLDAVRTLRTEKTKVGGYVPKEARQKIDALLARPKLVQEKLLRRVLEQDAMEETMRDVLFDALKEFNEKVNPFVADWGLPGIMKKLGPFGFGPVGKAIEGVRAEFDKRMEPEMRKFLQTFSRKALTKTGDLMSKNDGSPKFIELRKAVVAWIYESEVREFLSGVDDEGAKLGHGAALDILEHVSLLEDVQRRRRAAIKAFFELHAKDPVRKIMADYGGAPDVDTDALADATWPALVQLLSSEPVRAHFAKLLDEFWATVDPG